MAYNADFGKNLKIEKTSDISKNGEVKEVKLSSGKLKVRKALLALCATGSVLGLSSAAFGAANIAAIAIRPEFNLISLETLTWGLLTAGGFVLSKKCLPTTIRNTPKLKSKCEKIKEEANDVIKSIK